MLTVIRNPATNGEETSTICYSGALVQRILGIVGSRMSLD